MSIDEIFGILEIEPTKDENAIKMAYRKKLAVTNPEDNPEGFKRLRQAYELAVSYSKQSDEPQEEEQDTSPSGLWVDKAKAIYKNIHTRQDKALWESLFEEEVFLSIEGEELCREKLLVFMMANYFLPTDIWKLLDEKLKICKDSVRLKEKFPGEFINFIVGKCQRGEDVEFEDFSGPDEGDYDRYVQLYIQCWNAIDAKNIELASQLLEESKRLNCHHPVMDLIEADIMKEQGKEQEALEFLGTVYEKFPKDLTIAFNYGDLCWKLNERDRAAQVFLKIKEGNDTHYMSNFYLTEWYRDQGDYKKAKECGEKVMAAGGSDEFYSIVHDINEKLMEEYHRKYVEEHDVEAASEMCWCYLQNDEIYKGIKLAVTLEVAQDKLASHYSLLTKLYYEEGLFEESLDAALLWRKYLKEKMAGEEGDDLKADQDRIYQSYAIRVNAYHQMAYAKKEYFAEALKEAEALSQVEELGPHMLLEKAQIYIDSGEPAKAIELAEKVINEQQQYGAYATLLQAYVKMLDASGVVNASQACNHYFPAYARAYDEVARVYHDLDYPDELRALIARAKENGVESPCLDAYGYQLDHPKDKDAKPLKEELEAFDRKYRDNFSRTYSMKCYEEGYKEITRLFYENPSTYMLIERGRFSMAANMYEDAERDFKKVLETCPYNQFALNNLGCIYKYTGRYEKAIVYFRRAIRYMDDEPNTYPYGNLAHTFEKMGEYAEAAQIYQQLAERFPERKIGSLEDIICDNARSGNLVRALETLESYKDNTSFAENPVQYQERLYEAYKDANEIEKAGAALEAMERELAKLTMTGKTKYQDRVAKKRAWYELVTGNIDKALAVMDKLIKHYSVHTQLEDICEEMVFMITIKDYLKARGKQGDDNVKKAIWGIFKGKKEAVSYDAGYYAKRITEKKDAIDKLFYRQRYASYLRFISVMYTQPAEGVASNEAVLEALENMEKASRCRHCNDCGCINLLLVRALFLERQGKYGEAVAIYREMQKKYPYDWYSKAKLLYMEEE